MVLCYRLCTNETSEWYYGCSYRTQVGDCTELQDITNIFLKWRNKKAFDKKVQSRFGRAWRKRDLLM